MGQISSKIRLLLSILTLFFTSRASSLAAENWVVSSGFRLDGKLISALLEHEVSFVAPPAAVRVATYPVFLTGDWVGTPTEDDD